MNKEPFWQRHIAPLITVGGYIISLVGALIYGGWYIQEKFAENIKDNAVVRVEIANVAKKTDELAKRIDQVENDQNRAIIRIEDLMISGFNRIEDKLYLLISGQKKNANLN